MLREAMNSLDKRERGLRDLRETVRLADGDITAGRVGSFDANETKRAVRQRLEPTALTY